MKILSLIFAVITLVSSIIAICILPDTVAVHFDQFGVVDRWGSKYEILILPFIMIVVYVTFEFCIRSHLNKKAISSDDKEAADAQTNLKVMTVIVPIINGFLMLVNFAFLQATYQETVNSVNTKVDIMKYVTILVSLMIILMANYMPKTRKNSNVGFRLSWTRYNDVTWSKSNRFAAYFMMGAGAVSLIGSIVLGGIVAMCIMLFAIIISIIAMTVYAYLVYRKEKENETANKE